MSGGGRAGAYRRLFRLHARTFAAVHRLNALNVAIALLYLFGAPGGVRLTVSRGVYLFLLFLVAAVAQTQTLRRNAGSLSFYLRLPIRDRTALLLYYAAVALPAAAALALAAFLLRAAGAGGDPGFGTRFGHALFAVLAVPSLAVNLRIALRTHPLLPAGYFVLLGFLLIFIQWGVEVAPATGLGPGASSAALLLLVNYALGFPALRLLRV
ncbi:MAG: hypothetical protein JW958_01425 [Candidatus Eisenbacteria bacterium]|nr:hypothetical protein [Candidatus Eisenbacteria bacterium]